MEIWHKRIKQLRENTDITLKDMAKMIGVSEATVQRYESGKIRELPYKVIGAYAEKFHANPAYIMGWIDDPNIEFKLFSNESFLYFQQAQEITSSIKKRIQVLTESLIKDEDYEFIESIEKLYSFDDQRRKEVFEYIDYIAFKQS